MWQQRNKEYKVKSLCIQMEYRNFFYQRVLIGLHTKKKYVAAERSLNTLEFKQKTFNRKVCATSIR